MIRTMIIVVLIGVLLIGCIPIPDDVVTQNGQYVSSSNGGSVLRHIDYDAGVVCYTVSSDIACVIMEETKLR